MSTVKDFKEFSTMVNNGDITAMDTYVATMKALGKKNVKMGFQRFMNLNDLSRMLDMEKSLYITRDRLRAKLEARKRAAATQ